jgi:hypothetical protein
VHDVRWLSRRLDDGGLHQTRRHPPIMTSARWWNLASAGHS